MRPTFSIIFFTVLSGAGYGVWFLLGLGLLTVWPYCGPTTGGDPTVTRMCVHPLVIGYALLAGFVLVSGGLSASVAHLGRPARAWRAFSQWRSSWLSREGIAALLTYLPAVVIAANEILARELAPGSSARAMQLWHVLDSAQRSLGALLALGALVTVFCTANIYASLKPVRAWNNPFVTSAYLLLGLYSGALLLWALATLPLAWFENKALLLGAIVVLAVIGGVLKSLYWREIDRLPPPDAGRATGLDAQGAVRSFEQPHTEENYLTREMGFVLARRHATKLRRIALIASFVLPAALALLALAFSSAPILAWIALVSGFIGIFFERWLFFAEAKHAVIGYYAH